MAARWRSLVLFALDAGELHGFGIRKEIERLTDGKESPSMASLYEAIAHLLDDGEIERGGEKLVTVAGRPKLRQIYRKAERTR